MNHSPKIIVDGNEAAAMIAYKASEVVAIYPITPSSAMGESSEAWANEGKPNIWGTVPVVQEMQSEGGAAGTVHGALQAGALTTTFTASQGLLLMIPNMFKIAGELTPTVFHIAARSLATSALSIFGDHSDVMSARSTGWAMLFASNVQEAHDMALVAHAATLRSRVPFLHIFDGFRTSHEVAKITPIPDSIIRRMIDEDLVEAHRGRALNPDNPFIRGTAMNPDTFFQAREAANGTYDSVPAIVQAEMDALGKLTGRHYRLFDWVGPQDAERAIVIMGSGAETVEETLSELNRRGAKVGVLKVRLYRPFDSLGFVAALPKTVRSIAVLDRTKEPGASGEPLYKDVVTALAEHERRIKAIGGRYGLSSKEFTPAMVKAVVDELTRVEPKNHFTLGIIDDVTHTHLELDPGFTTEATDGMRAMFWGLGSDGTVSANKSTIKIVGDAQEGHAQGYFVYDSKKSGSITTSHLRFSRRPIQSAYLIERADFVAVHQWSLLDRYPVLANAGEGATLLLNSPIPAARLWENLPARIQGQIREKNLKLYVIDAHKIARENGLGGRINTVMQVAFFRLTDLMPFEKALTAIRNSVAKAYGKRGKLIVEKNLRVIDASANLVFGVPVPSDGTSDIPMRPAITEDAPTFVRDVLGSVIAGEGNALPVSALPIDGTFPSATSQYEKRAISRDIPVWDPEICIQCGKCVLVCPHAVIRAKVVDAPALETIPLDFKRTGAKWKEAKDQFFTIQISGDDCTGCTLCVDVCPAVKKGTEIKALEMTNEDRAREDANRHWKRFLELPDLPQTDEPIKFNSIKNVQLLRPLFEFSGACSGCGETPYLKLVSQLFGDHAIIANATGCSSIYGGNLPTTPWAKNSDGRGPAWANSLFEDNAEFGFGIRLALDARRERAMNMVRDLKGVPKDIVAALEPRAIEPSDYIRKRAALAKLKNWLTHYYREEAHTLDTISDALIDRSVWIIGGDGWAYDIGFGGLDHVLAQGRNVNVMVLDTEVYSNTGGQSSKSTPLGASAKFASGGKGRPKKDLGMMMMEYGNVYVAQVAMGANDAQLLKAMLEAEAYDGPSLIIAYGHCIAHGMELSEGLKHQKLAVETGYWPLYRYNPMLREEGKNPFQMDSREPSRPLSDYLATENRFATLMREGSSRTRKLLEDAQRDVEERWRRLHGIATSV